MSTDSGAASPNAEILCALLVNPNSGGGTGADPALWADREGEFRVVVTNSADEARDFVAGARAEGFSRVIVSGGDDSVRDMLPALLESSCELGIVPRGTFNNLARALGIPLDPAEALELALSGQARPIDLGRVADLWFTESAGVGYLAEAWNRAPQPEPTGFLRWATGFVAASSALMDYQPLPLRVRLDGEELQDSFWDLTVANSPLFANNIHIAPGARLDDGLLDVCLWPAMTSLEFLGTLPKVLAGSPEEIPQVRLLQARRVEVFSEREIPLRVDNAVTSGQEFCFEVLPNALRVVRPEAGIGLEEKG